MTDTITLTVTTEREVDVPVDILGDDDPSPEQLRDRGEDWFWNHWSEALYNEPAPRKADITVESVAVPGEATADTTGADQ